MKYYKTEMCFCGVWKCDFRWWSYLGPGDVPIPRPDGDVIEPGLVADFGGLVPVAAHNLDPGWIAWN